MRPEDARSGPRAGTATSQTTAATAPLEVLASLRRKRPSEPLRHCFAAAYLVTARSGRQRLVLMVTRCPRAGCEAVHQHVAAPDFEVGIRSGACGRYVVHAVPEQQRRAA